MPRYSYALDTSNPPTNVESLATPVYPPRSRFYEASVFVDRADGQVAAHGFPYAIWLFDTLTQAMVDQLRTICPGQSAEVYLTTRKNDGTFATYSGVMIWPQDQMDRRQVGGVYRGIEITFRRLEAV